MWAHELALWRDFTEYEQCAVDEGFTDCYGNDPAVMLLLEIYIYEMGVHPHDVITFLVTGTTNLDRSTIYKQFI